jgi:enterochelin esterase-like enzyme/outer membrane protein assembly factor BamB
MPRFRTVASLFVLALTLTASLGVAETHDWPDWAGPDGNRSSNGNGLFEGSEFGLKQDWLKQLGSGYSGITVVGDVAVTGFSDEESDFLIGLDIASGKEMWRYRIAKVYKGHSGSDDGPIATPAVHKGLVFGMGAWGELFAINLNDGKEVWKINIHADLDATSPVYGFAASPVVVDGVLVVLTGAGEGQAISGFEPSSGKVLWSSEDGGIAYQSPLGFRIGDRSIVLATTGTRLFGIDPKTGDSLFEHQLAEEPIDENFAHPVPVGDDSVFLNLREQAGVYRISDKDGSFAIEEVWLNNAFRGNYSIPVYWEGHLYGYSGSILKCVDAKTGKNVWRSRPPGMGYLILVDGHLTIQTDSGDLVIAEASPEGYQEKTRIEALANGYYTHPSFASGKIFTRNLSQIASLSVTDVAVQAATPPEVETELLGDFGKWVQEVEATKDKQAMVDKLLASNESFPIKEGDRLVHFVYKGEVDDLALTGGPGSLVQGPELPMHQIEGTDFYYRSMDLEPASIYTYRMTVWDDGMADPLNPDKTGPEGNEVSIVTTGGFKEPDHLAEAKKQGSLEEFTWKSALLENERQVQFYLPHGYAASSDRYPVLVVNYGDQEVSQSRINNTLDNLIADGRIEPIIVVLVPRNEWAEYGGAKPGVYAKALAEELLPYTDKTYRTNRDRSTTGIMGVGSAGFGAMYTIFAEPDTFGMVATQSFYFCEKEDELREAIKTAKVDGRRFYIESSKRDYYTGPTGLDARANSDEITEILRERGFEAKTNLVGNGPDWTGWAVTNDGILEAMYAKN